MRHILRSRFSIVAVCTLLLWSFSALAYRAEAASVTWTQLFPTSWWFYWNGTPPIPLYAQGLFNPTVQVNYCADILNETTGVVVAPGAQVKYGDKLLLRFTPHRSEDIYWFGTGGAIDSPYGEWRAGAAPPGVSCASKDFVEQVTIVDATTNIVDVYIPLVAHPPTHSMSGLDGLQCGAIADYGESGAQMRCTVQHGGQLRPVFNIGATYGIFYYRYMNKNVWMVGACQGNNIGMAVNAPQNAYVSPVAPTPVNIPAQSIPYPLVALAPPPVLSCTIEFDKNPLKRGESTVVRWNSAISKLFYINGLGYVGGSGSARVSPGSTTDYSGYVNDKADGSGKSVSCPATLTVSGSVACPPGQVLINGKCTTQCPPGFTYRDGQCVFLGCPLGYVRQDDKCVFNACPEGYFKDGEQCARKKQCTTPPHCEGNDLVNSCTGDTVRARGEIIESELPVRGFPR